MEHSKEVGGSTCGRLIACPGSKALCDKMPPQPENEYMARGTLLHNAMDRGLSDDKPFKSLIGLTYKDQVLTEELYEDKIVPALEALNEIDPDNKLEYRTEVRVDFGEYMPGVFGTTDLIGRIGKRVISLDWKFGDGVKVSAENGAQGMFYVAAAMRTPGLEWVFEDAEDVEIIIVQPPSVSRWVTTFDQIKDFEHKLKKALDASRLPNAELNAGPHCKFCAGKPICPKMTGAVDRAIATQLKDIDVGYINAYLKNADILEGWITDLRALAHRMMEEGNVKLPDWKLVAKRATRKWTDPKKAEAALKEAGIDPYAPREVLSPAQAEKALKKVKKELPDELVVAISSGNTLAPKDDPRPEVLLIAQQLTAALGKLK